MQIILELQITKNRDWHTIKFLSIYKCIGSSNQRFCHFIVTLIVGVLYLLITIGTVQNTIISTYMYIMSFLFLMFFFTFSVFNLCVVHCWFFCIW